MKNKGTNKQQEPNSGTLDTSTLTMCIPSFNFVPKENATKTFNVWKLERKKNEE